MLSGEPVYVEGTLPSSGARFRLWVGAGWAVLEANGLVSFVPNWRREPLAAQVVADMAVALFEASQ